MWAAWSNSLRILDLLVVHGADPHAVNYMGANAAHWAAAAGHLDVCVYLYELGVDFLLTDRAGKTPMEYAAEYNRQDVLDWMLRAFGPAQSKDDINYAAAASVGTPASKVNR